MVNNEITHGGFPVISGRYVKSSSADKWITDVDYRDADYVMAAARGDQTAFAYLFETRIRKISRYVQNIVTNTADTEETVAEVFVTAWKKLGKLNKPERFDAWLFRIAHNLAMDCLRKMESTEPLEGLALLHPDPDPHHSPENSLELTARKQIIQAALLELSGDQREVLTLRFLGEMSHSEVAFQLGKSVEAVRALQSRGIKQLRTMMR